MDVSSGDVDSVGIWRSLSDMDLSAMGKEACTANKGGTLQEDPEAEADLVGRGLITEKEETESSDDITTQYSIHPPFDFPYFLLLQGYSHRQVRFFVNLILLFYNFYNGFKILDALIKILKKSWNEREHWTAL